MFALKVRGTKSQRRRTESCIQIKKDMSIWVGMHLLSNECILWINLEQQFAAAFPDPEEQQQIPGVRDHLSLEPQRVRPPGYILQSGEIPFTVGVLHTTQCIPYSGIHLQLRDSPFNIGAY